MRLKPGRLSPLRCPSCDRVLTLCQPDMEIPEELVGTCKYGSSHSSCEGCRSLYLICLTPDWEAILLLLPSTEAIRDAILSVEGAGG